MQEGEGGGVGECCKGDEYGKQLLRHVPGLHQGAPIRGLETSIDNWWAALSTPQPPNYCHRCGKPYPWAETRLQAAREFIDSADELTAEQKETLKQDVQDLATDSPKTELAAARTRKRLAAISGACGRALQTLVTDIASETAKKMLMGP